MNKQKSIYAFTLLIVALFLIFILPVHAQVVPPVKPGLSLRFIPDIYYRDLNPGQDNTIYLEVGNYGSTTINNIRLHADVPGKWVINISPSQIDSLGTGSFQTVNVNIIPLRSADNGEYNITLIAEANETQSAVGVVVRIQNAISRWLWIGLGVAAFLIAGFIFIYRKFGRE